MLDAAGIPAIASREPVIAGDVVGELTRMPPTLLGIGPAIPVVAGIVDALASYLAPG